MPAFWPVRNRKVSPVAGSTNSTARWVGAGAESAMIDPSGLRNPLTYGRSQSTLPDARSIIRVEAADSPKLSTPSEICSRP